MKKTLIAAVALGFGLTLAMALPRPQGQSGPFHAQADGLALTPPMGWYPWNIFGQEPQNEKLIKETVDALVSSGLKDAGYAYVGPDEGICFFRGADGKLSPNLERYPSGLRGLGDYIHKKGLKYALYTDAGTHTCSKAMPGTKGYEYEDMRAFADWRADYIKIDWCNTAGQDIVATYSLLAEAQRAAGRPVVHSLCSWGDGYPWKWAGAIGHMWRTTSDICGPGRADWNMAVRIAFANEKLAPFAGPGRWNDPDMMIAGMPGLSEAQNRTFFSLWCMMAAPLMAGNDLRGMTPSTVAVLTNLEAIAINQDPLGAQGHVVWNDGNVSLCAGKPLFDGSRAALLFAHGGYKTGRRILWEEAGFDAGDKLYVRNLWTHETSGPHEGGFTVAGLEPGGAAFLRISKRSDFPIPPVVVADTTMLSLRAGGGSGPEKHEGTVTIENKGSSPLPPWKVDPKSVPSWLTVTVAGSGKRQTIVNTVTTAGLKKGAYHAQVRVDNVEPISGRPMSAFYYDVDLEVARDESPGQSPVRSQTDLIKSGHVRLVEEVRIADKDLPENALFQNPRGVAVDARGSVYVSDFEANHIKVFGPDGKFRTTIGRKGQGPGDLSGPSNIEISGDRIIVWEAMNRRFSILDMKGGLIKTAKPIHGGWGDLMAIRALPDGRLAAFIEKGLPDQFQGQLPGEREYAMVLLSADLEPLGTIYEQKVLNRRWTRHPETQGLIQIGFPYHPRVEAGISADGTAAVGWNGKYEIGLYDFGKGAGKQRIATLTRPYTPIKLEERDKQAHFPQFKMVVYTDGKRTVVPKPPDYIVKGTDFPEFLPPYRGMIFDGRGRLWVQVFTPGREMNVFDIFGPKGEFLGRVTVEGATIDGSFTSGFEKRFVGDHLWKIEKDADGFAALVRYHITPG